MSQSLDPAQAATLVFGDQRIDLLEGESVLEGLERAGVDAPAGCRAGTCCKCMQQADNPPPESQRQLRPTLRAQGFFLACQAYPKEPLYMASTEPPAPISARVVSVESLSSDVRRLRLRPAQQFTYRPGQYLDVLHSSAAVRSYSIASLPSDGLLELHVRRIEGGLVSGYLHELEVGADVSIRGAFGQCFHVADDPDKPLLLVGAGTGLAPLLGIARDALDQGHRGAIRLVHGGLQPDRLYLRDELAQLAETWPQLSIHPCVLRDAGASERQGALDQVAVQVAGSTLGETRAFLCGDSDLVRILQRSLFLAGMSSAEILADPFDAALSP